MDTVVNEQVDLRLPIQPNTIDPKLYVEFNIIYNALRQLQHALDGFYDIPPHQKTGAYTLTIDDRGHSIDTTANVTVPLNTGTGFPIGTTIVITNVNTVAISIIQASGVTLFIAGTATTGTRTLAARGMCTLRCISTNVWIITGAGIS